MCVPRTFAIGLDITKQYTISSEIRKVSEVQKSDWLACVMPMLPSIPEQEELLQCQKQREQDAAEWVCKIKSEYTKSKDKYLKDECLKDECLEDECLECDRLDDKFLKCLECKRFGHECLECENERLEHMRLVHDECHECVFGYKCPECEDKSLECERLGYECLECERLGFKCPDCEDECLECDRLVYECLGYECIDCENKRRLDHVRFMHMNINEEQERKLCASMGLQFIPYTDPAYLRYKQMCRW